MRSWIDLDSDHFVRVLEELGFIYVPIGLKPGPMVVFPEYDLEGIPKRAQTKPLYNLLRDSKYVTIGVNKNEFRGPIWLGNQEPNLRRILDQGYVVICEGPFDLLALRLACPDVPSMSSLTKNLGEEHILYLRMLGLKTLYLMYDNETSDAGNRAMRELKKSLDGVFDVQTLLCPADDPSDCLKSKSKLRSLQSILADL